MKANIYCDFSEAKRVAIEIAGWLNESVAVIKQADGYAVIPPKEKFEKRITDLFDSWSSREFDLRYIQLLDKNTFASKSLAWTDTDSGLTWDIARLFFKPYGSVLPQDKSIVLNSVNYAGFSDWRMPSIEELRTLVFLTEDTPDKVNLRPEIKQAVRGHRIWSNELFGRDEEEFFDYITGGVAHQRFREQDKNRSSWGDGYTAEAETVLVRSKGIRG